jgi:hypothetical protein
VENTALGFYWARQQKLFTLPAELQGKPLCSECAPALYIDGHPSPYGKWHDNFPKMAWKEFKKRNPKSTVLDSGKIDYQIKTCKKVCKVPK